MTGLIPGAVQVLDGHHHVLAQQNGVTDVGGSLRSVYGLFGLGVAFLTVVSFLGALIGSGPPPPPRLTDGGGPCVSSRPGLGLGLVINFTLSATRVFVPEVGRWVTITVVSALVIFGLGYLTPTPDLEDEEPAEPEHSGAEGVAVFAIAARPGVPALGSQEPPAQLAPVARHTGDHVPPARSPTFR